jgi:RHS repeat-associated protein
VVYTGWLNSPATSSTRGTMQQAQTNATTINENKQASGTIDGIVVNYSNNVLPNTFKLLTVNYYDNYTIPTVTPATTVEVQTVATMVKGLATGSWTRVPTTTTEVKAETSYTLYDYKYRPIRSYTTNYLGGYTYTDSKLDVFSGQLQYTIQKHKRTVNNAELTVKDTFTYTQQDRLIQHTHQINGGAEQLLAENTYDELGQLISKKVGNTSATPLQKVDYSYNIRGWMTAINSIANLNVGTDPADLFGFKLNYNIVEGSATAANKLYNGNIAETFWSTATDGGFVRNYGYKYDQLNRLKDATYQKSGQVTGMYNENLSYDKNGNIMNLSRYGDRDEQYLPIQIDNLGYNYATNSNKLMSVVDNSNNTSGFKDGNTTGDDYVYDGNGNMTVDKNKNITAITYNHLNLPTKIIFPTGNIVYFYTASGQKVQKVVTENTTVTTTDYLGGYQYKNTVLQYFPTTEGYVKNTPVSGANTYSYVYNYTDHLGNTRLSYTKDTTTGSLKILEESNYYPFGLMHKGYNNLVSTNNPAEKLLFNGKELQDELNLNTYDFGARMYDPSYVRTPTQDPLAEKFYSYSSYSLFNNNPIFFTDPTGMAAEAGQSGVYYDWDEKTYKNKDTGKESTYNDAIASHSGENSSSSPTDWIKNNETGEVKWFDGTGQKAVDSANKHWGFFNSKGKTTNLGSSFFGTTGESDSDSYQIKNEQLRYLLSVSNKINKMAGVAQNQDILGSNLAFEYLKSTFFGVPFEKSSTSSSDLPGVIWDYGGGVTVEKHFVKGLVSATIYNLFDAYLSSQQLGVGSDRAAHLRANEVNYFKTNTVNYITPATLFSINLHKF